MKLYAHQQNIIDADPKKTGLWLGTGAGKTRIALLLARKKTLIICPKTQKEDKNWFREHLNICDEKDSCEWGASYYEIISKETFRRDHATLPRFNTVIIDEAHTCLGVTPNTRQRKKVTIPRTSQLFEAVDAFLERTRPDRLYLCTATIVKSPMTVWGAAKLLGKQFDFYAFRSMFYVRLPMPGREVWMAKKDNESKDKLATIVRKLGYTGRLEDWFDVPDQTYRTVHVGLTVAQKKRIKDMALEFPDPIVKVGKVNQIENGCLSGDEFSEGETFDNEKEDKILEYAIEFPRMVIFAKYRAQIRRLQEVLGKQGYKVLTLTGDTKDRGGVIKEANGSAECIFIVQAQVSAGWELPEYPVMIFASRTYSFVDYSQALGRIQRANNIKKNLYINLVVKGGVDEAIDACLTNKQDFQEKIYIQHELE